MHKPSWRPFIAPSLDRGVATFFRALQHHRVGSGSLSFGVIREESSGRLAKKAYSDRMNELGHPPETVTLLEL
jgi:hypothetical protein